MATQNKRSMIDARWQHLQPGWGNDHSSERRALYEMLSDGENIEAMVSCTWGPASFFRQGAGRMDRMRRLKGVALVTGERLILLKAAMGPPSATEMPLDLITSVELDAGDDGITITGLSLSNWMGNKDGEGVNKIAEVRDGQAQSFAERVREIKANPPTVDFTPSPATAESEFDGASASAATRSYAGMNKAQRIDTQWRERSTMWGRNEPSPLERIIGSLMANFTGEKTDVYPGELRLLHEILEEDENIEYWMGGRWGDASDFDTMARAAGRAAVGMALRAAFEGGPGGMQRFQPNVHDGVVVATDRRVLMLNSGMVSKQVVEIPYAGLQVAYNEGMITAGVKLSGSTEDDYAFYWDHNSKSKMRSRARPLYNAIRRRATAAPGTAAPEAEEA